MLYVAQFQVDGDGEQWLDAELLSDMTYRIHNGSAHEVRVVAARGTDTAKKPMVTLRPRSGLRVLPPGASVPFPVTAPLCDEAYAAGLQVRTPEGWYMSEVPG